MRWMLSTSNGIVEYATTSSLVGADAGRGGADGNLWVTEYAAKELVAFTSTGTVVKTIAGPGIPLRDHLGARRHLWIHRKRHDAV